MFRYIATIAALLISSSTSSPATTSADLPLQQRIAKAQATITVLGELASESEGAKKPDAASKGEQVAHRRWRDWSDWNNWHNHWGDHHHH